MADANQGIDLNKVLGNNQDQVQTNTGTQAGGSQGQQVLPGSGIQLQSQKLKVVNEEPKKEGSELGFTTQETKFSFSGNSTNKTDSAREKPSMPSKTQAEIAIKPKEEINKLSQPTIFKPVEVVNNPSQVDDNAVRATSAFAGYAQQKAQREEEKRKQKEIEAKAWGWRTKTGSTLFLFFSMIAVLFLGLYIYHKQASKVIFDNMYERVISVVKQSEEFVTAYIPINDYANYANSDFTQDNGSQLVADVISSNRLNYVHKRDITNRAVHQIGDNIVQLKKDIDSIKSDTAEFGLFNKELAQLLGADKTQSSIQESLLSLETIKFATALQVFSLLDTFTSPLARNSRNTVDYVKKQMRLYVERAEVDISNYLQSCYLNPFESSDACKNIGDFDKYFQFLEPRSDFDGELFKQMIVFADQKLEEDEFPNLNIQFDRFDPASQKLSFTVSVNTTSYDRKQLEQLGIVAPQVFVITNLVNLLKQSKFVLGESININKLNIVKKDITVGGNPEQVYSTDLTFSLPLQKSTQREIFDYQFQDEFKLMNTNISFDEQSQTESQETIASSGSGSQEVHTAAPEQNQEVTSQSETEFQFEVVEQ